MTQYFTPEGLEKIKKELEYLKKGKTKEIADLLKYAASFGDLSENAAYDDAKERQTLLHLRIKKLEKIIAEAEVVEKKKDKVSVGSNVIVLINGEKEKFQITSPSSSDILENKISYESPLGEKIIDKKIGDKFTCKIGDRENKIEILEIN